MWRLYHDFIHAVQRMTPEEYLILAGVTIVIGLFCLRGFGSRTNY